ncbi:MAG: hypothetical protein QM723_19570 [Myxococcaceae bacterium]
MKKTSKKASVVLALGLGGCGLAPVKEEPVKEQPTATARGPAPVRGTAAGNTIDDAAVSASIQKSLDRLSALQLFTVEGLVMDLPANASDCYGVPCPGDTAGRAAWSEERSRQAARLEKLATQAESCNSGNCYIFTPGSPDEALQAINGLKIVHAGSLIAAQPANNPSCYNLPCDSDRQAADAENQRRAVETFTIASYSQDL